MTLKFKLGHNFYTMYLPTKFHHPMVNHLEVITLTNISTNKQKDSVENINLAPICYVGGEQVLASLTNCLMELCYA